MPFKAEKAKTGELVRIFDYDFPRVDLDGVDLACPFCKQTLYIRRSCRNTPHFYHAHSCTANIKYRPGQKEGGESPEHTAIKQYVYERLCRNPRFEKYIDEGRLIIDYEVAIKEGDVWRIADVAEVSPKTGKLLKAYEIQISPITISELEERTNDYHSLGVDVEWVFVKKAATIDNEEWALRKLGKCWTIEIHDVTRVV